MKRIKLLKKIIYRFLFIIFLIFLLKDKYEGFLYTYYDSDSRIKPLNYDSVNFYMDDRSYDIGSIDESAKILYFLYVDKNPNDFFNNIEHYEFNTKTDFSWLVNKLHGDSNNICSLFSFHFPYNPNNKDNRELRLQNFISNLKKAGYNEKLCH